MNHSENIQQLFQQAYNQKEWLRQLRRFFPEISIFGQPKVVEDKQAANFLHLGNAKINDQTTLGIYEIKVGANTHLARNRVQLRQMVASQILEQTWSGALAVYVDDNSAQWRFSYIAITHRLSQTGEIERIQTPPKRFTYLLGEGAKVRTAVDRFDELPKNPSLQDLQTAFAVESLNKEFYKKLYEWYEQAQSKVVFPNDEQKLDKEAHIATSLIRLLTRLLFIWFLKEKYLVNPDLFDKEKLQNFIYWHKNNSFYKAILQNLFFATLNHEISDRSFRITTRGKTNNNNNYLVTNIYRYRDYFKGKDAPSIIKLFEKTPFLNGGLFECLDREATKEEKKKYDQNEDIRPVKSAIRMDGFSDRKDNVINIPNNLFFNTDETGLIDLLSQYQFTVEESTPLDVEVALDPELLGKVFENLLATYNPETKEVARKATGSYYTPREIVDYMADESLKAYLQQAVRPKDGDSAFYAERLTDLFNISRTGEPPKKTVNTSLLNTPKNPELPKKKPVLSAFYDEEIPLLIKAIDNVRILDPAVGSGAFPMGILQRLVALLECLDPENQEFKQRQLDKAEQIEDGESCETAKTAIEAVFGNENAYNHYGRKLYLIENCLYGVDIQPIAIQIAKLRFFISLAIEQQPNNNQNDNYGIKALPNLETRFIATDSLLTLGELPENIDWLDQDITSLQNELADVRRKYFNAKTLKTKRKYQDKDKCIRKQIVNKMISDNSFSEIAKTNAKKIASWDLYNQNSKEKWFNPQWMFGIVNGFDIVIGNPPYIQLQKNDGELGKRYEKCGFHSFTRSGDIYQLFYEKGIDLLKNKTGILSFITSNKWMRAKYGKKLRMFFASQTDPFILLDFKGFQVFENTTVDTNILFIQKAKPTKKLLATSFKNNFFKGDSIEDYVKSNALPLNISDDVWFIGNRAELALKKKIERIGTPLKNWNITISYGIKTGYNKAFIVDNRTKEALIDADPNSSKILKPILRGQDIKRHQVKWAGKWLIATLPSLHVDIESYPAIKKHLFTCGKSRLEQTGKTLADGNKSRKKTPHQWFELQDTCAYYEEFEKEKIVYPETMRRAKYSNNGFPRFSIDSSRKFVTDKTVFILVGDNLRYLVALLNSKLTTFLISLYVYSWDDSGYLLQKIFVERFSIPKISPIKQQPFVNLVDKIIEAKADNHNADTSKLEAEIDQRVYKLYGLTDKEIAIIEENT